LTDPSIYNEHELITRIANGDESAFRAFYDRHWNAIYSSALAYTKSSAAAQEIVQETFVRVWKSRQKLTEIDNLPAYIFVIARNRIKTHLKNNKPFLNIDAYYTLQFKEEGISAERQASLRHFRQLVFEAIDQLPPQQAAVFRLSRFEELSYEEISERLNISSATVRHHLIKALNFMRIHFAGRDGDIMIVLTGLLAIFF